MAADDARAASRAAWRSWRDSRWPTWRGRSPLLRRAWDDALAELEAGLAVIDDTGNLNFVLYYEALLASIAIHRGDLATAQTT